jgi:hypothetical protein
MAFISRGLGLCRHDQVGTARRWAGRSNVSEQSVLCNRQRLLDRRRKLGPEGKAICGPWQNFNFYLRYFEIYNLIFWAL